MNLVKLFLVPLLVILTAARTILSAPTRPFCNDPARERLDKLWMTDGGVHDSIYQVSNLLDHLENLHLDKINQDYVNVQVSTLSDSTHCPYSKDAKGSKHPHRHRHHHKEEKNTDTLKLCPDYDVINYDENRIPSTMFEKRCSCTECRGGDLGFDNTTAGCKEVVYHTKVLRRVGCNNNEYVYQMVLEPLVVGCACENASRETNATPRPRVHTPPKGK